LKYFKYQLVWVKNRATGFLNAKKQPLRIYEDILVFYRKQPVYNPQKTIGRRPVNKNHKVGKSVGVYNSLKGLKGVFGGNVDRHPTNLLRFPVVSNDGYGEHRYKPTQKPVALLEYLIKTYSDPGATVFDFCFGSGSTAIACANTNRDFIGSEISRTDYLTACERLSEKVSVSLEVL
jgi:site-specific DNA-methyltransferase (adenine-specific)